MAVVLAAGVGPASAQVAAPTYDGDKEEYPHFFPIGGKKLAEKGIGFPLPLGLNVNYAFINQDIRIENLQIGFNDSDFFEADFVQFGNVESTVNSITARLDLWVFPFLNVYGILGGAFSNTDVSVESPVTLTSNVDQNGLTYGVGGVLAGGYKNIFVTADANFTWTNVELLNEPVRGTVLGLRGGYAFDLPKRGSSLSLWAGAQLIDFGTTTDGTIALSDAIELDPDTRQRLEDWANSPGPPRELKDRLGDALENGTDLEINYRFDKRPAEPWAPVIGVQYAFDEHWWIRAEGYMFTRWQFITSISYRFGLPFLGGK